MRATRTVLAVGMLAAVVAAPVAVAWQPTGVDQRETVSGPRSLAGANATGNVTNVTSLRIARLHLRNVQVEFVTADRLRLEDSVDVGDLALAAGAYSDATSERVFALNVTLYNVTFEGVTIWKPALVRALLGDTPSQDPGNVTVETATVSNVTVETAVFDFALVGNSTWNTVRVQTDRGADPPTQRPDPATLQADAVRVENAIVNEFEAADVSVGNETNVTG